MSSTRRPSASAHKIREAMASEMKGAPISGVGRVVEVDGCHAAQQFITGQFTVLQRSVERNQCRHAGRSQHRTRAEYEDAPQFCCSTILIVSMWAKINAAESGTNAGLFSTAIDANNLNRCFMNTGNNIDMSNAATGVISWSEVSTTGVTFDAWQHLVLRYDSTQATADDRARIYVNGSQLTDTTPTAIDANEAHALLTGGAPTYFGFIPTMLLQAKLA